MKNNNLMIYLILITFLSGCAVSHSKAPIEYFHSGKNTIHYTEVEKNYTDKTIPIIDNDKGLIVSKVDIIDDTSVMERKHEEQDKKIFAEPIEELGDSNDYVIPNKKKEEITEKSEPKNLTKIVSHQIQAGETLQSIAKQYGQSIIEIAKLNSLSTPYSLVGRKILKIKVPIDFIIPTMSNNKVVSTSSSHQVKPLEQEPITDKEAIKEETAEKSVVKVDFIKPVNGQIISKFGDKTLYGTNKGINIAAPEGAEVVSTAAGKVIYADYDGTFGNLVIVKLDSKNIVVSYSHLEDIIVTKGASINQGEVVGYVGKTGKIDKPQLHFGIREGKEAKDPLSYISY